MAFVSYTILIENSIRKFPRVIWIYVISINLESQIANVEYFRFPSFQMQESSFSTEYQAHSQEGFEYLFILTKLYTLGKAELLAHIKQILRIRWLRDNAEYVLSSASWHFITLSVNCQDIILCETLGVL